MEGNSGFKASLITNIPTIQFAGGSVGAVLGLLMVFTGMTAESKSTAPQIYAALNYGLGIQTTLIGGFIATKGAKKALREEED